MFSCCFPRYRGSGYQKPQCAGLLRCWRGFLNPRWRCLRMFSRRSHKSHMPQMEEKLNESPCSTSLEERRKPHAISRKQRWLRVSAGTRETQHPGPRGNAKNPRAQKTHCCSPGSSRRLLVPDEPGTPTAPQTCPQAQPLPRPDATSLSTYLQEYQKRGVRPFHVPFCLEYIGIVVHASPTNVPRSLGSPDHPSTPSPHLTHVREEQGEFYPKDMGLIVLCLMLCTLVAKQHAPGAPPDQEQGPYHLDNILEM
ncbi:uncharacterized protein LOC131509617 [Neofelis nebulosa]|uniref:uncharacterized protein LOC131509617 n=1 Tax=Neofelis nebulosa TaxID=61452 RepID=UPI00272CD253|nr:uncharacterized protein LOC131509617 [Neofelis nebulosa]